MNKCTKPYKSYQNGGLVTPNPPKRNDNPSNTRPQTPPPPPKGMSKEEMQRRVAAKSKAKASEQVRQIERERRDAEMDRRMNEGYRKATGRN